jgi:hypothetical protein
MNYIIIPFVFIIIILIIINQNNDIINKQIEKIEVQYIIECIDGEIVINPSSTSIPLSVQIEQQLKSEYAEKMDCHSSK